MPASNRIKPRPYYLGVQRRDRLARARCGRRPHSTQLWIGNTGTDIREGEDRGRLNTYVGIYFNV